MLGTGSGNDGWGSQGRGLVEVVGADGHSRR